MKEIYRRNARKAEELLYGAFSELRSMGDCKEISLSVEVIEFTRLLLEKNHYQAVFLAQRNLIKEEKSKVPLPRNCPKSIQGLVVKVTFCKIS